jgi:radical SAM protein with 4Fe4S-binding SPASM domain
MKKKYVFHQFVKLDRGPVNTCISDFLTGDIFQVPNTLIEKFEQGTYSEIPDFITSLKEATLIIRIDENAWIPPIHNGNEEDEESKEVSLLLETEEGVDIDSLLNDLESKGIHIMTIHLFSESGGPDETIHGVPVKKLKKDNSICKSLSTVTKNFSGINERTYFHYKKFNPCWGSKIAITKDLAVRPCIYSGLILGNIAEPDCSSWEDIRNKADQCRRITKSQIERCKECEFIFVCFDCREIARVEEGDLFAANPNCPYDPINGTGFKE